MWNFAAKVGDFAAKGAGKMTTMMMMIMILLASTFTTFSSLIYQRAKSTGRPRCSGSAGGKPIKVFGAMASHRTQVGWQCDEDG